MRNKKTWRTAAASVAVAAAIVLGGVAPAQAASNDGWQGPCGGPTYPTVQYKNNDSYTETAWRTGPTGSYLKGPAQYSPGRAVYFTSSRQSQSYNQTSYGNGTSFQYFSRYCN